MSTFAALADYGACAREWVRMSSQHRLARPADHLGMALSFRDGTTSRVFRETVVVDAASADPVLLVIAFRLAFLDDVELLHAGFRHECLIHTPLFAGFPGFRTKLWLGDDGTRIYRGVYQWEGGTEAAAYARRMVGLLAPFSNRGTARYHVVPGLTRAEYLRDPDATTGRESDAWWRLGYRAASFWPVTADGRTRGGRTARRAGGCDGRAAVRGWSAAVAFRAAARARRSGS